MNENKKLTKKTTVSADGNTNTETVYEDEVDANGNPVPKQSTVITNNEEGKTTLVTNFNAGKKVLTTETKDKDATTTVTQYNENEQPTTAVVTQGEYTVINYAYVNGERRELSRIENKGLDTQKDFTYEYNDEAGIVKETVSENNGNKTTTTIKKGDELISREIIDGQKKTVLGKCTNGGELDGKWIEDITDGNNRTQNVLVEPDGHRLQQVKQVGDKTYGIQYDGEGNTLGVIVQNHETIASIAKKFGVTQEALIAANPNAVKGNGKNRHFNVGAEIKIPREMEADEKVLQNRKDAAGAIAEYKQEQEEIRIKKQQQREYQKALNALGYKNSKGAGKKITDRNGKTYTIVGQAGFERTIVKDSKGNLHVLSWDRYDLKMDYVQTDIANVRAGKKRIVHNNRAYYADANAQPRDKHGRYTLTDWTGQRTVVLSGGKSRTDWSDRVILRNDYVAASDNYDANQDTQRTQTTGVGYGKGPNGQIWYFDDNNQGKALTGQARQNVVKKDADYASKLLLDGAKGAGTDEDKLLEGVEAIYSNEIFENVNRNLAAEDNDYKSRDGRTSVEMLILDEETHGNARPYFKKLIANGAMTTQQAANCVQKELEHEVHGYTKTSSVNDVMDLCLNRDIRLQIEENMRRDHPGLSADNDSFVRAYLADDGWNAQEVDQFDSKWVANESYQPGVDQKHRNGVIGRLCFDYKDKEALHKGLEACSDDPNSEDYKYLTQRAVQANNEKGYTAQFTGQEAVQTYLAGRSNDGGEVDVEQLSACNTLLFKSTKPARVQAEEALYGAKKGDMSNVFNSMDSEVYDSMAEIMANGDIPGCKTIKDAYNKAYASADQKEKTSIKANAILSGHVDFSKQEITDFCIELMHSIDDNKGNGASTGQSARHTNDAEYQTELLKAILAQHPEIIADVKAQVEKGKFSSTKTETTYIPGSQPYTTVTTTDTKAGYLDIINNTQCVVKDEVFLDVNGNKITDPAQIAALKQANMEALQQMREYVAQLEREFKMGVDEEGWLDDAGNVLVRYSGIGTDRDDVANKYREAKNALKKLEAAAQGRLRDNNGNVVSAQQLAQSIIDSQETLAQKNADYKSSVGMAKMGIVLAPVIVVTTVVTGGVGASGWAAVGTVALTTATVEGAMYGTNLLTSETGNTAENRAAVTSQVVQDAALAAFGTKLSQYAENFAVNGIKAVSAAERSAFSPQSWKIISKVPEGKVKDFFGAVSKASAKMEQVSADVGASVISRQANLLRKAVPDISEAQIQKAAVILARGEAAGLEITSDTVQTLGQMYLVDGEFNEESFIEGMIMSVAGNSIGHMTSLKSELKAAGEGVHASEKNILDVATADGTRPSGGAFGEVKFNQAKNEVAGNITNATPESAAKTYKEADLHQNQSREQGREIRHIVEDGVGFVEIGKKRIPIDSAAKDELTWARREVEQWQTTSRDKAGILERIDRRLADIDAGATPKNTPRSQETVELINNDVNQTAENILNGKKGALAPHDAATLSDHITNNLNSVDELESFINSLKNRVGVDANGKMHVYQVEGKDQAAEVLKQAQSKLTKLKAHQADFEQVTDFIDNANSAQKGLTNEENKALSAFIQKTDSAEELEILRAKLASNKKISKSSVGKKLNREIDARVADIKKATVEGDVKPAEDKGKPVEEPNVKPAEEPNVKPAEEPNVKPAEERQGVTDEQIENARQRMLENEKPAEKPAKNDGKPVEESNSKPADELKNEKPAMDKQVDDLDNAIKQDGTFDRQKRQIWADIKDKYKIVSEYIGSMKLNTSGVIDYCQNILRGIKTLKNTATGEMKAALERMENYVQKALKSAEESLTPTKKPMTPEVKTPANQAAETPVVNPNLGNNQGAVAYKDWNYSEHPASTSLSRGQSAEISSDATLILADRIELDLSSPEVRNRLNNLKNGESLSIGRSPDSDIVINNKRVSRNHLTIKKQGDRLIVIDNSANGTKISERLLEVVVERVKTPANQEAETPVEVIVEQVETPAYRATETPADEALAVQNKITELQQQGRQIPETLTINGESVRLVRFENSQSGSNRGYWVKNEATGELLYVKYPTIGKLAERAGLSNDDAIFVEEQLYGRGGQATSEALAADLYRAAGFESPNVRVVNDANGEVGVASSYMANLKNPNVAANAKVIREGFATDCWLANWDALKDGNVMMHNGNAVRTDVGGSLCYRARGERKGTDFQENVDELTSFFDPKSLSIKYLQGMTRDELLTSLKHVTQIDDATITQLVAKAEANGMQNPAFMREMLMERRNYMRRFESICQKNPIKNGESIKNYVRRIANQTPRVEYNIGPRSFDKISISSRTHGKMNQTEASTLQKVNRNIMMSEHLTPSQKRLFSDSYAAFGASSGRRISHDANNILTSDNLLHGATPDAIEGILNKGLLSREYSGRVGAMRNDGDPGSMTPMCADLWEVQGNYSIHDYFRSRTPNQGESNFITTIHRNTPSLIIVFDKTTANPTLINNSFNVSKRNSILYQDGNMSGHTTYTSHRAVPVGLPANTIDRIIIPDYYRDSDITPWIIKKVKKSGLDIKVYDLDGKLLYNPTKKSIFGF